MSCMYVCNVCMHACMDGWMDVTCLSYDDARAFLSRSMKVSHEFWPLHRCGEVVVAPARNA